MGGEADAINPGSRQIHRLFAQFASDLDASTQQLLARGSRLTEVLKQPQFSPYSMEEQVVSLFSGVNGFLDNVEIGDVVRFEQGLLSSIRESGAEILDAIRAEEAISEKTEEKLKAFISDFAASFS